MILVLVVELQVVGVLVLDVGALVAPQQLLALEQHAAGAAEELAVLVVVLGKGVVVVVFVGGLAVLGAHVLAHQLHVPVHFAAALALERAVPGVDAGMRSEGFFAGEPHAAVLAHEGLAGIGDGVARFSVLKKERKWLLFKSVLLVRSSIYTANRRRLVARHMP